MLALISTAPILSETQRAETGENWVSAMMITFAIAPSLPANDVPVFSFFALWLAMQQILIGIALGFTMQFAFRRCTNSPAKLSVMQMGLSFATFCRSRQPSQYARASAACMNMLALLLFLSI